MGEVEKIEAQIQGLSPDELAEFRAWFIKFDAAAWDRRIEADVQAGKLDELIEEARAEFRSGRAREI
jgi:hypothetical protein